MGAARSGVVLDGREQRASAAAAPSLGEDRHPDRQDPRVGLLRPPRGRPGGPRRPRAPTAPPDRPRSTMLTEALGAVVDVDRRLGAEEPLGRDGGHGAGRRRSRRRHRPGGRSRLHSFPVTLPRCRAERRRAGLPRAPRPRARRPRRRAARLRARRGRAAGGVRARARALAARRRAADAGGVAVHGGAQPRDRQAAPPCARPSRSSRSWACPTRPAVRGDRPVPDTLAELGDERLALLFTCCHPALAPEARVALTLQAVGGPDRRRDRARVPRARRHDVPAAGARQAQDPRRRDLVRAAGRRRAARPSRRRARRSST